VTGPDLDLVAKKLARIETADTGTAVAKLLGR
jgi:hypothetical protein